MRSRVLYSALLLSLGLTMSLHAQEDVIVTQTGTAAAPATEVERPFYVSLNSNYALNYEGDENLSGFNLEAKLGYELTKYVAVELESGWFVFNADDDGDEDLGTLHMVPLIVNGVLKYPMENGLVPYASGGFGVFFFGFNEDDRLEDANIEVDMDNAAVGFKVAVGADYWINESWAVNLETGYFFIPDPDASVNLAGTKYTGEAEVDTWYVGGGIKYRFG